MELLPIGSDKLKVTLTEADMESYRLSADSLCWEDTGTRKALWTILDEAKRQCGFDAAREKVLVQIFPCLAGGCEMFVTRIGDKRAEETKLVGAIPIRCRTEACIFDRMTDMLAFCKLLDASEYDAPSSAYSMDDGRFLLIYYKDEPRASEFGSIRRFSDIEHYIGEHTETICSQDAVFRLAKLT